jgi:hypothetical protein
MLRIAFAPHRPARVDGKSLRIVGFIYATVTAAVIVIAAALVHAHDVGLSALDGASQQAVAPSSATFVR